MVDRGRRAITDLDYSAAQSIRVLLDDLRLQGTQVLFGRVSPYLRSTWIGMASRPQSEKHGYFQNCTKRSPRP